MSGLFFRGAVGPIFVDYKICTILKCPCFQSLLVRFKHKTVKKHTAWRYVIYTESPDIYCMGIVKRVVWYVNSNCSHNVFSHSFNGFIFTYNRDSWVSLHNLRYIYSVYRWMQLYRIVNSGLSFSYLVFKRCRTFFFFVRMLHDVMAW